jgi:Glycosyltransferase family 10 (fucosyltransferase) C-term
MLRMLHVNILTRYDFSLFSQHIDDSHPPRRVVFTENGGDEREWDLVVVFDGLTAPRKLRVREGGLVFVAGEPPDAMTYTQAFLSQFAVTYCAHPNALKRPNNHPDQYFNNWHFGHDPSTRQFRWTFAELVSMQMPEKTKDMSVIMSNLAYMPNHLKRRHFLALLQERFGDRIDVFGRGHRFIPFKDEALVPYRYHICIENCAVPDLWTEKLADPLLGWSVPVYGGCPNVEKYFPADSLIRINMDRIEDALAAVGRLLGEGQAGYLRRVEALREARRRVLHVHNMMTFAERLAIGLQHAPVIMRTISPNEQSPGYKGANSWLRVRRYAYRRYFLITRGIGSR